MVGLGSLSGGGVLIAGGGVGCTDCFQNDAEPVCRGLSSKELRAIKNRCLKTQAAVFYVSKYAAFVKLYATRIPDD